MDQYALRISHTKQTNHGVSHQKLLELVCPLANEKSFKDRKCGKI